MSNRPPRRIRFATDHFRTDNRRVLDVGCGAGNHLRHFGEGSVGLELDPESIAQGRSRSLDIRSWNFEDGIPAELEGGFDVVWASNLFEHVLAPHSFLIDLRRALRPNGLLLMVVPLTRLLKAGPFKGHLAADHVNFFTVRTLRLTIQRAGYDVEDIMSSAFPGLPIRVSRALARCGPSVMVASRPISDFRYPPKAHKHLENGRIVFDGTLGDPGG